MSEFKVSVMIPSFVELERMKFEIRLLFDWVGYMHGIQQYPDMGRDKSKHIRVWEGDDGQLETTILNGRLHGFVFHSFKFGFSYSGDPEAKDSPRYYGEPANIIMMYSHIQDFMDGIAKHFPDLKEKFEVCRKLGETLA